MTSRDWRDALALGGTLGAIVLGLGGRVAMRIVANANWQEPVLTASGTLTVVGAATLTGAAGGAMFLVSRWLGGRRRVVSEAVFWGLSLALALRILQPLSALRLELFLPLTAVYGIALEWLWARRALTRTSSAP